MIGNLSTSLTKPRLPTLAQIERRRHELLTQAGLHSHHQTSPASLDPASPPTRALPTPAPLAASAPLRPSAELKPDEAGLCGLSVNPAPFPPESQPEPQPPLGACPERSRMGQEPPPAPQQSNRSRPVTNSAVPSGRPLPSASRRSPKS